MDISIKMIFQVGLLDCWIGSSAGSLWRLLTCSRILQCQCRGIGQLGPPSVDLATKDLYWGNMRRNMEKS